ncbi:MAG: rRNA maturation RNase YbeY [Candidatus Omnitrophota bacterium]
MLYTIHIHNQQRRIDLNSILIKKFVQAVLQYLKVYEADLSVVFVTDKKIQSINRKFLNHDFPTDVISFDLSEKQLSRVKRVKIHLIEGEIYISTASAVRNAKEYGSSNIEEILLYIIHGILHLLGHNDHSSQERKRMRRKEQEVMDFLRRNRP